MSTNKTTNKIVGNTFAVTRTTERREGIVNTELNISTLHADSAINMYVYLATQRVRYTPKAKRTPLSTKQIAKRIARVDQHNIQPIEALAKEMLDWVATTRKAIEKCKKS